MKRLLQFNTGYIFLFSILVILIVTPLFQYGLFGDGILYLAVAFNRFKGYGSFWSQHFSSTSMSFFCEQPPLYFETLAWVYKLFGGAEIAERVFTLILVLLTVVFLILIWKKLNRNTNKFKRISWLPCVLLFFMPVVIWTYSNQVIESMVIPLTLMVFYVHLIYMEEKKLYKKVFWFCIIIILLFSLLLTKGIQAVFPLTILFFAGLSWQQKDFKKIITLNSLLIIGFGLLSFFVFYYNNAANFWLKNYFEKRLIATFNHVGATTNNHFDIIFRYLIEQTPLVLSIFLLMIYFKISIKYPFSIFLKNITSNRVSWWLVFISLSGAIPLALTLEQRGFYITPSIPFVVIAVTFACKRYFFLFFARLTRYRVILSVVSYITLIGSLIFFTLSVNTYKRDEDMLKDIALVKKIVPYGETIGFDKSMWNMFGFRSYVNKANNNDFSVSDTTFFYILDKDNKALPPVGYKKINYKTYWLDIYCKEGKKL
jgi:hypothetical protein